MLYRKLIIKPSDGYFKDYSTVKQSVSNIRTNIILLLATIFTTTVIGSLMSDVNPFTSIHGLTKGLSFSIPLLSILGIHEFGHYFAAKYWGVSVTLPYFIPAPFPPIGTFGAVIKMKSSIPNRKALVDIGAAGPIAGFIVAIAVSIIGLSMSEIIPSRPAESFFYLPLGDSIIFRFLADIVLGKVPENSDVFLHPIAFAGWLGLFVTALNLIPFGQLDGGHILFALSPRFHELLRRIRIPILLLMGLTFWTGWYVWALILFFIGSPHPYPDYMDYKLGTSRKIIAFIAIIIFFLCIIPTPVKVQ